jgi:hypothetical protein
MIALGGIMKGLIASSLPENAETSGAPSSGRWPTMQDLSGTEERLKERTDERVSTPRRLFPEFPGDCANRLLNCLRTPLRVEPGKRRN